MVIELFTRRRPLLALPPVLLATLTTFPFSPAHAGLCDRISTASESLLTTVRVARRSCTTDPAIACSNDATCRFCVGGHTVPCTANSQCASAGGLCGPPGTCMLAKPLYVTSPPGDTHRIFIVEQDGKIRILKDGLLLTQPFLDIDSIVQSTGNEQGLLGLAFSPSYATDRYFFVYYTENGGANNTIARYRATSDNPDEAAPSSGTAVLSIPHSTIVANHNGGCLQFGPHDGFLYIAPGDGGDMCDPPDNAQNIGDLRGKLLRIDVIPPPPAPPALQYRIPSSNPYVGPGAPLD